MISRNSWLKLRASTALALFVVGGMAWTARFLSAQSAARAPLALEPAFAQLVKPFLTQNCVRCHNADAMTSGVRVDHLDSSLDDRHVRLWETIRKRVGDGSMPPKGLPQPTAANRQELVEWITRALEVARSRPTPRNGLVRRLTVSQYRNTLRQLLLLEDDLTETLPPDAISKDGFVNNKETLQLSPLLMEAYFEIAEEALNRSIVDPKSKPSIQNFRVDLGASVNSNPIPDELILGAGSQLLKNSDVLVTQLTPAKPFAFEPFFMRTRYRFIEGYQGNDTVRGWRDFDSIYHSVFADLRGKGGYPKGNAYSTVPQGLLLRPAIPSDELFGGDGTYGPRANFKISLRELPDHGRFRVTVAAARYDDGLLLDPGAAAASPDTPNAVSASDPKTPQSITIKQAGVYQVDIHASARNDAPSNPDSSRLADALAGSWTLDGTAGAGQLEGNAKFVESPFGQAVALDGTDSSIAIPRTAAMNVGEGEFTLAAWIHPRQMRKSGLVSLGGYEWTNGWYLDLAERGVLRLETAGPDNQSNGSVATLPGTIRNNSWQHVAAVVRRGKQETMLYVNGFLVAKGAIGPANLDNPKLSLRLGRMPDGHHFRGEMDEVRLYRRALEQSEIYALVQPGRELVQPPPEKPLEVKLTLGEREFSGTLQQPAFLVLRLEAGPLPLRAENTGVRGLDRVVFTPLAGGQETERRFLAFEKRAPKLGVHLGLRRDCGSTFAPVGAPQVVAGGKLTRFLYEGAIANFPSPNVEKDNVNYLAGIKEIAVRSEYTDGRDMPRLLIRSVEFEGPFYESWPPSSHRNIFVDFERKDDQPAYARKVIRTFAARAYRRPVSAAEEAALMAVYQKSSAAGRGFQASVKDALQVVLTSPQFLFLTETSTTPKPEPLDQYELASKLSYFLWNGPPDRKTLKLAEAGTLASQLDAEVDRLVADSRFTSFLGEFASQWLSLDKFQVLEPDRNRYPKLTRDTRTQLKQEPVEFLLHLIRHNLPARNLIQSGFVLANEAVADYYGLAAKTESGFQFVAIPHGRRELGGVLTQAAIMAGLSDGRESNPVKRGAWVARKIIAEPPADPPPNVPALKEDEASMKLSLRQRIERHRSQPGCAQCHSTIDPWGVAFEEFDAGGRLKQTAADARSTLPDKTEVAGIDDLRRYLADDRIDQVAFSVLKHLMTYATGRTLGYSELDYLKRDALKLRPRGYRMKDMVRYVVHNKLFLEK